MVATKASWKHQPFSAGLAIPYRESFTPDELQRLRAGLVPEVMEDKWFAYFEAPHLYLHRSWGGHPVFRVALVETGAGADVSEALCVAEQVTATGAEYQARLLDFLISSLMLGKAKPFPVPEGAHRPETGLLQHHVAGTGFAQSYPPTRRSWWQFWRR